MNWKKETLEHRIHNEHCRFLPSYVHFQNRMITEWLPGNRQALICQLSYVNAGEHLIALSSLFTPHDGWGAAGSLSRQGFCDSFSCPRRTKSGEAVIRCDKLTSQCCQSPRWARACSDCQHLRVTVNLIVTVFGSWQLTKRSSNGSKPTHFPPQLAWAVQNCDQHTYVISLGLWQALPRLLKSLPATTNKAASLVPLHPCLWFPGHLMRLWASLTHRCLGC